MHAGFHRKYITYTITTKTDLRTFSYSPVTVVRRFSDFVALETLLKVQCSSSEPRCTAHACARAPP